MQSVMHTIRALSENDIKAFQALRHEGLIGHPDVFGETAAHFLTVVPEQIASQWQATGARGGFVLGAFTADGSLVGVVGLAREEGEKSEHRGLIWGMYVTPNARGLGLARNLMIECLSRANAIPELEQLHLSVVTSNHSAIALYQSLGFETYGTDPAVLKIGNQRFDEYLMVKVIRRSA